VGHDRGAAFPLLVAPLLAVLPLVLLCMGLLLLAWFQDRAAHDITLTRSMESLSATAARDLTAAGAILKGMADQPGLATGSPETLRPIAQAALGRLAGWHSIALEEAGRRLMDLRLPPEAPPAPTPDPAALARLLATGLSVTAGPRDGLVTLRVPVLADGAVRRAVVAEIPVRTLEAALGSVALPAGWRVRLLGSIPAGESVAAQAPLAETDLRIALFAPRPSPAALLVPMAGVALALALGLRLAARRMGAARLVAETGTLQTAGDLARAAKLERRRADLLATVSHELRAPLTGLLGYTELLAKAELPPVPRGWVEQQRRAGQALLALVGDVLDFARLEDGAIAMEDTDLDIFELLADSTALMRALAQQKALGLTLTTDPGLPRWVRGDPLRLRQVVTNLLGNAVKFTERGEITVAARLLPQPARIELTVSDTGIGIPAEELPRVFDRFHQGTADTARRFGGSGLGLAICRRLVTAMGGTILAESEEGQGSRFIVRIPFRPGAPPPPGTRAGPLRLLVAEDVPASRLLLSAVLERAGHKVTAAEDGPRALAAVHSGTFDLAIIDLQMPGLDGFGVAAALRTMPGEHGRMALVALTAKDPALVEAACRDAGFDAVMQKPFETRRLLGLVEALGRSPPPRPAPTESRARSQA
jgi:signal transduction histidine kinase/CheY-like chemotaxis protein